MCQVYLRYWSYSNQQNRNSCPLCIYLFREKNPILSLSSPPSLLVYVYFLQASSIPVSLEEWKAAAGLPVFLWNLMGDSEVLCTRCGLSGTLIFFSEEGSLIERKWKNVGMEWQTYWVKILFWKGMCYCERDKAFRHVGNVSGCTQLGASFPLHT